jgi:hypothetical protein
MIGSQTPTKIDTLTITTTTTLLLQTLPHQQQQQQQNNNNKRQLILLKKHQITAAPNPITKMKTIRVRHLTRTKNRMKKKNPI